MAVRRMLTRALRCLLRVPVVAANVPAGSRIAADPTGVRVPPVAAAPHGPGGPRPGPWGGSGPTRRVPARGAPVRVLAAGLLGAAALVAAPVARAETPAQLVAEDPRPGATAMLTGVDCTVEQAEAGEVGASLYPAAEGPESEYWVWISLEYTGPDEDGLPSFRFVIPALPAGPYLGVYGCGADSTGLPAAAGDGPLEVIEAPWASSHCSLRACGWAVIEPSRGGPGARVAVIADWPYFATVGWLDDLYVRLHEPGDILPGSGREARLTVVDGRRATFTVPEVPPGRYTVLFAGEGGDEAFGQPIVRDGLVVTRARPPDTAAAPASARLDPARAGAALAAGIAAFALALWRPRRTHGPGGSGTASRWPGGASRG